MLIFGRDRRGLCSFLLFRGNRGQFLGIREHAVARRFLTRRHRQLGNDHALVGQPPRIRDQKRGFLLLDLFRARRSLLRPRVILPRLYRLSRSILAYLLDPDRSLLPRTTLFRPIPPDILRADLFEKEDVRISPFLSSFFNDNCTLSLSK